MQLIFDVSTLARSSGQAVGIVRVVRELARWARSNRPDTAFAIYDSRSQAFRHVRPVHLDALLEGFALVDSSAQPDRVSGRRRLGESLPGPLRGLALWVRNPRRRAFVALEGLRRKGGGTARLVERLQARLLKPKHRAALTDSAGNRRTMLTFEAVAGDAIAFHAGQALFGPGSDWSVGAMERAAQAKAATGVKIAYVLYDTVPLLHPDFYPAGIGDQFLRGFQRIVALADIVFVTAATVADDVRAWCAANDLPAPRMGIFRLGADLPLARASETAALPAGLEPGRYALLVGTIEPRKGHRLMFEVWKRLLDDGVPQRAGFKLVFLGRRGWLVDDLVAEIEAHPSFGDSLLILSGVSDNGLAALYQNAAFGVLPSLYEGYGLPVVESFRFGKAVLASTGGALEETVGEFSPCLDPWDEGAWLDTLRRWIIDPTARTPYEAAILERFRHPTWAEAAAAFFSTLDRDLADPA